MDAKNGILIAIGAAAVVALAVFAFYMVDIDQTQDAKLPDVNVEVKGGQAPKFDVDTGKVKVGSEDVKVKVPEVKLKEETVTVPTIKVEPPKEDGPADKPTNQ